MTQKYSAAFTEEINDSLTNHLARKDLQEDICFALYHPSSGAQRFSALIFKVLLPREGERQVHGNASFNPEYYERVLDEALKHNCGIAMLHSHPLAVSWQPLSPPDYDAESALSSSIFAATNLPLLGLTLSGKSKFWSARFWFRTKPHTWEPSFCGNVRVVGEFLSPSFCPKIKPDIIFGDELNRTIHAWGEELQQKLAKLRIGIVGLGSVGQLIAECLSRMGMSDLVFIDFDTIEIFNLDRTINAYPEHVKIQQNKAVLAAQSAYRSSTAPNFSALPITRAIQHSEAYRTALDCDVLFSGVDKPLARSILNHISYAHLIPVIDGGIDCSQKKNGHLRSADWGVFTVGPGKRCLACHGQYNPGHVSLERDGMLDDLSYVSSLPLDSPLRKRENVLPFSMTLAGLEVQKLIHLVSDFGIQAPHAERYSFPSSETDTDYDSICEPNCSFEQLTSKGDSADLPGIID